MNQRIRDYNYHIKVNGKRMFTGDAASVGIIFGNLDGRNFVADAKLSRISSTSYSEWLERMSTTFGVAIDRDMRLEMLSPGGALLSTSSVGASLTTHEQEAEAKPFAQETVR